MTAQIHDLIHYEGRPLSLAGAPPLPEGHPRLRSRPPVIGSPLHSTACLRGHQGTWSVEAGRLFLTALEGIWELLPGEPLFAEWVSGELRVVSEDAVRYVHGGFASEYAQERLLTVERGVVTASREIDRRGTA